MLRFAIGQHLLGLASSEGDAIEIHGRGSRIPVGRRRRAATDCEARIEFRPDFVIVDTAMPGYERIAGIVAFSSQDPR